MFRVFPGSHGFGKAHAIEAYLEELVLQRKGLCLGMPLSCGLGFRVLGLRCRGVMFRCATVTVWGFVS